MAFTRHRTDTCRNCGKRNAIVDGHYCVDCNGSHHVDPVPAQG